MSELNRHLTAARRAGHEAAIDLRKRRTWYADDPPATPAPATPPPPATSAPELNQSGADDSGEGDGDGEPKKYDAEYVKKLRKEAAEKRTEARELKARLDKLEAESKQREEKELTDKEDWRKLAEKYKADLAQREADLATERLNGIRTRVGVEFKLPAALVARLHGATEDEIRDDASALAKELGLDKTATPEQPAPATPARSQQTTTAVPGGQPVGETNSDRQKRYFGGPQSSPIFQGAKIVFNGNPDDLKT